MIKFKPKILCPNPASMCNLFRRGGQNQERECASRSMKEYKLCSDKCCASFFPCWQNCSSCLTSRRTDPWRWTGLLHGLASYNATLLFPYAITCKQWVLFAYRINHLRCSWALSKAPCRGRGAGLLLEARHASHTESTICITFTKEGREKENAFYISATAASSSGREMG